MANIGSLTVTLGIDVTQLDKSISSMNTMAQKFRTFGYLASAALTLPIVAASKATFQLAKDFEFSMQKIVGLTGVAQNAVNAWSDEILKLGPQLGKGPQELAEAMYFISSSGIKGAEAMDVLKLSAKAATAGLGQTQQVADLLTSALNAYRGTGLTAAYATDVLVAAVREGKAEAAGFSSAMGQIIPIASQLGVSFDQVAGGMAAITLTGSSSSNAAVYLKGVFNSLLTASTQGEKALAKAGTSYKGLRDILANQGLIALIQKLRDIQVKYDGDELLSDVLPNIRALTGYLSLAGKNFQYNTELMKRVEQSTGSLGKAFAAVADTIKVRYDQAISQAQVSMIELGKSIAEAFLPILEKLVIGLENLTKWFNSLTEEQKRHTLGWVAFIAILGPASLAIAVLEYSLTGLMAIGKKLIFVFNGLRISMLSNPYLLVGAGVIAITGGIIHFIRKTNEAAIAQNSFNTALVKVNDSIKKLKDLTSIDYGNMNFMQLAGVKEEAIKQKALAFKMITEAVERSGHTMDQFYAGEKMGKYTKYIDSQVASWNSANAIVKEVDGSLDKLATTFVQNATSTKIATVAIKEYVKAITKIQGFGKDNKFNVSVSPNNTAGEGAWDIWKKETDTKGSLYNGQFGAGGDWASQQAAIDQYNQSLMNQGKLVQGLTNSFSEFFQNTSKGLKGMFDSLIKTLQDYLAKLAALAVVSAILNVLVPGSGAAVGALTNLRKFVGVPGYANGTMNAPGGLSLVGERGPELVNLPRGAQVLPAGFTGAAMRGGMQGDVWFHIEDNQLVGILRKAGIKNSLY